MLLHGLVGWPSNWDHVMDELEDEYRLIAPHLPIDNTGTRDHKLFAGFHEMVDYVDDLIIKLGFKKVVMCGNSLGGQVAIDYTIRRPDTVDRLIITGSSGIFEHSMVSGKRPQIDRPQLRQHIQDVFFDPRHCTEELLEKVYDLVHDKKYVRFLIKVAKAARNRDTQRDLHRVKVPTLLVWGENDSITPRETAVEFQKLLPHAELRFIANCGHSPPIEHPETFAHLIRKFLKTEAD